MTVVVDNEVSKLFRAYGLYNISQPAPRYANIKFQSSFELTGYITSVLRMSLKPFSKFQSSFELTGYITKI